MRHCATHVNNTRPTRTTQTTDDDAPARLMKTSHGGAPGRSCRASTSSVGSIIVQLAHLRSNVESYSTYASGRGAPAAGPAAPRSAEAEMGA